MSIILLCFLLGWWWSRKKGSNKLLYSSILLLVILSNDFLSNEALLLWEVPPTPIEDLPDYDVGILLTGITHYQKSPPDRVYLNHGADRIFHTIMLYKLGKIKKILISGGSGSLAKPDIKEADELAKIARISGVPDNDIIIENRSRNTRENALFSAEILASHFSGQRYLLITSAFHLRRAKGCFEKVGVHPDLFSTDFYSKDRDYSFESLFIPNPYALVHWQKLIRELIGILAYKVVGYL